MQWSEDVAAARWIVERLHPFAQDVGSLVPEAFAAYARIRHPEAGTLDRPQLDALLEVLPRHAPEPGSCWFAIWDGYAWLHGPPAMTALTRDGSADPPAWITPPLARIQMPSRSFALYRGGLDAARALWDVSWEQSPNLWWPDDRSWCVATEIDLTSTYLGGSAALVRDLLDDRRINAQPARPGDPIGAGA
ncbi:hypothetical protein OHA72_47485 [Dactylosporangium sp. NBC_01737]|uniref:hypothetical protein n=1 Tax=Dactylosporangium sp. NBC_01737 TaxID=2975959 RepID=UPI002E125D99|nr:hypothetical protein OHA72_47485 [Dactylosporangium sp. NBC_01737]